MLVTCFQFRDSGSKHTSDNLDLSDTVGVTEDNTDLGWSCALLGKLADLVDNLRYVRDCRNGFVDVFRELRTCSGVVFNHAGAAREYGMAEADMPFPLE